MKNRQHDLGQADQASSQLWVTGQDQCCKDLLSSVVNFGMTSIKSPTTPTWSALITWPVNFSNACSFYPKEMIDNGNLKRTMGDDYAGLPHKLALHQFSY